LAYFSCAKKVTVNAPRSPRIPPRSHQQNTTPKTLFSKTPHKNTSKNNKTLERITFAAGHIFF
jgi:hypothetical protein